MADDEKHLSDDLPRAHVKRIVRAKLAELLPAAAAAEGDKKGRDVTIQKEALQAFAECGKMFIHYLTANANDICQEAKRSTVSADDVLRALEDLDFAEFLPALQEALGELRKAATAKKADKKRKAEDAAEGDGARAAAGPEDGGAGGAEGGD